MEFASLPRCNCMVRMIGVTDGCSLSPQILFYVVNCEERTDADQIYTPISLIFVVFPVVCLKRCLVSPLRGEGQPFGSVWRETESSPRRGRLFANVHEQRRSNIIDVEVFSEVPFVSINSIKN